MTDKKICNHIKGLIYPGIEPRFRNDREGVNLVLQSSPGGTDESFNFCPLCGKPLKSSALDKLLLKTLGLEEKDFHPYQSLEDALEAFFSSNVKDFESYLSFDKIFLDTGENTWDVACRGEWFRDKSLKKAVTKALLWATTELTKEEVEELFQKGASHDS